MAAEPAAPSAHIQVNRVPNIVCQNCGHNIDLTPYKPLSRIECPNCGEKVRVPGQIDHYMLVEVVARGASGMILRAFDENLHRQVAIKLLHTNLDENAQEYENVVREAQMLAAFNHLNIAQIYSMSLDRAQPYIVMELIDGGRLDHLISKENQVDEQTALGVGVDIAAGLGEANRLGILHGDIKPSNILWASNGRVKLVDFGLAIRFRQYKPAGQVWGTPYYMAPEVVRGQEVDHRCDMYSLGATLYHAVAGRPPFTGDSPKQVMLKRLQEAPPPLGEVCWEAHGPTIDVIHKLMSYEPDDRPEDMNGVISELQHALNELAEYDYE